MTLKRNITWLVAIGIHVKKLKQVILMRSSSKTMPKLQTFDFIEAILILVSFA
jgi:hypothetical protein